MVTSIRRGSPLDSWPGTDPGVSAVRQIADTWGSSGFVAESVPLALHAARDSRRRSFAEVLERAIEAGGDSDTIGSITGQVGAALGSASIPRELLVRLRDHDMIAAIAEQFAAVACAR